MRAWKQCKTAPETYSRAAANQNQCTHHAVYAGVVFAGTADGVVGGIAGAGIVHVIMAVSTSAGICSVMAGVAGSCGAWTVASMGSGG